MNYITIKCIKLYREVFDLDTYKIYNVVNPNKCSKYCYCMLTKVDSDNWRVVRCFVIAVIDESELYPTLPYFTQLSLFTFYSRNFAVYKTAQRFISYLNL